MTNAVIAHYEAYNQRRYSAPWACKMTVDGKYDFGDRVSVYTGNARNGEAGDLVITTPEIGQVYGYGQKDHRGGNTVINYAKWDGESFAACDKLGR